ncbi:5'-methylthioadenosine/adenosylhomocysteine nucleosidase [Salinispira pacifica]|uniref:adenosylhomocysteine nucleosidase n=1 Tax=Salinispira pacifica TaxID=1307761 RepID=V5WKS8_9SPIO|nr:5'-methylthioadenosine/adenosylhomocysteine nucleosidase [Salinispira pacifica]AHC16250.1 5'-methylthioadenosine nucleosidase/ S-adenosylhomocysteine nucleosidase [Salinispira pacifica]
MKTSTSPIVLLGAMDGEIEEIRNALNSREEIIIGGWLRAYRGTLEGRPVVLAKSGVGKAMCAMSTQAIFDHIAREEIPSNAAPRKPGALIFTGLAGSLNPELHIGDTLIAADCIQHDLDATALGIKRGTVPYSSHRFLESDPDLLAAAEGYRPESGRVHRGRVLTGDQFIARRNDPQYAYLREELEGDGVEMEGAAAALCAKVNSVPFLLARTISDEADGKAEVKFREFLIRASQNSLKLLTHIFSRL